MPDWVAGGVAARDPVAAAAGAVNATASFEGLSAAPLSVTDKVAQGKYGEMRGLEQQGAIPAEAWRSLSTNKAAPPDVKQYASYYDWADAQRAIIAPKMAQANAALPPEKRKTPGELDQLTEKVLNGLPAAKAHDAVRDVLKTQWVAANPHLALDNYDRNQALPWREQKPEWSLTQPQRDLARKVLSLKAAR